jgi:insertion element IS1 protein InsB
MKWNNIASDYWKPCEHIIPKEKHIQTKVTTFTVEGYNSLVRHFFGKNKKEIKMRFKESGNIEVICSFAYAVPERKFIYL